jgi:DNA-binding IclR family transcriptional regulator
MNNTAPALSRGCEILDEVGKKRGINSTELASDLKIPPASLNRMLKCLLDNGYLEQISPTNKGFKIGTALTSLVMKAHEDSPLTIAAKKILMRLSHKWQQTFVVYEYKEPFQIIWRCKQEQESSIKTQPPGLITNKMNINAQGQLFLSQMPNDKIIAFFDENLAFKATQYTIMTANEMIKRADEIREKGYAFQERENHVSMKQIAVPLKLKNISGTFALGCFLPVTFNQDSELKDDMMFETGRLIDQE